jgi:cholesterol oxidase
MSEEKIYDYIVIGSGFGGSVSAMRLSEKGYSVLVLEKGKKYENKDFPKTNWQLNKYLWIPLLRCFGFQKLTMFKEAFVLSGVGVGGGSLVYANTLLEPDDKFYQNPIWSDYKDWKQTLKPHYEKAKFMLGVTPVPKMYIADQAIREVAKELDKEISFEPVNVGVYFGDTQKEVDPYFKGHGPLRKGCIECAGCMVGCRHNAKNTLDKNYLWFAQKFGASILAETMVDKIEHSNGLYSVYTHKSTSWLGTGKNIFKSKGIVFSGGVLGTMELLLKQKYGLGTLPNVSDKLGHNIRTNSESLCGISDTAEKMNHGVAISSIFQADKDTHIEIVKFPDGSNAMKLLATIATGNASNGFVRTAKMLGNLIKHPTFYPKMLFGRNWSTNTIILLVMQTLDNSMRMVYKKGFFGGGINMVNDGPNKVPSYIETGQKVMHLFADMTKGKAGNALTEVIFNVSTTAHILGGIPMGKSKEDSVVDTNFQVHGYPNMIVCDGSIVPCNLGVNPSLTITALSEYAMAQIPIKPGYTGETLETKMASN